METPKLPGLNWETFIEYQRGDHDPNGANLDTPHTPNFPYRLAYQIQESIVHQVEQNDYYVGQAERDDMATDLCNEWYNRGEFEPPEIAFDALMYWRRMFRGHHG